MFRRKDASRWPLLIACLVAVIPASALAQDPRPPGSPLPSDPVFKATRLDGTTVSGRIRQLGPDGQAVLTEGSKETTIPIAQLFKLTREGESPASPPEGSVVVLPDGDRLVALVNGSGETSLEVSPKILGDTTVSIPLDALLALLLSPTSDLEAQESLLHRLTDEPRTSSVLWLANGDRQEGDFLGVTGQKVTFQREGQPATYERSAVVAIGFDPAQAVYPRPKGTYLELSFHDGSRLGVTDCRVEGGQLVATTRFGATIKPRSPTLTASTSAPTPSSISPKRRKPWPISSAISARIGGDTPAIARWMAGRCECAASLTSEASAPIRGPSWHIGSMTPTRAGSRPWWGLTTARGPWAASSSASWSTGRKNDSCRRR